MRSDFGIKLDEISTVPFYCVRTLFPVSATLTFALWNAFNAGFMAFLLAYQLIIIACAVALIAIMLTGLGDAYSNRLEIYQRGIVVYTAGYPKYIPYNRIGRFEWSEQMGKPSLSPQRILTCSIYEKGNGNCIVRLSSVKYSGMSSKLSKLQSKLRI